MGTTGNNDPLDWLRRLSESYKEVRFGRGVVGKTGHAMIGVLAVWAIIAWRWNGGTPSDYGLLAVGLVATAAFMWWTRSTQHFAERNPAQALLEGAEFLEYHKFEAQVKGLPPPKDVVSIELTNPPSSNGEGDG
jgi:hypothetical protein